MRMLCFVVCAEWVLRRCKNGANTAAQNIISSVGYLLWTIHLIISYNPRQGDNLFFLSFPTKLAWGLCISNLPIFKTSLSWEIKKKM